MRLVLLPNLWYQVVTEDCTGKGFSRFFTYAQPDRCREKAMTYFLECSLDDAVKPEEVFVSLYLHHRSGERVEILSSATYGQYGEWAGVEREFQLFTKEKIKVDVVVYDPGHPQFISLIPAGAAVPMRKSGNVVVALAQNYWLFFGRKQQRKMSA